MMKPRSGMTWVDVQRVAAAIQGVPELRRQDAALVRDLFAFDSAKL